MRVGHYPANTSFLTTSVGWTLLWPSPEPEEAVSNAAMSTVWVWVPPDVMEPVMLPDQVWV
jgi:hypothetical protein